MTKEQLYIQAQSEWRNSTSVRQQYPTFIYYWQNRYERVFTFNSMERITRGSRLFNHVRRVSRH